MSISFNHFPANWALPLVWIETDPSQAGTVTQNQPALLVGQAFVNGAATAVLKSGATGNGTIAMDANSPVHSNAVLGQYKAVFSSATSFTVKDPSNVTVGTGTVGTVFNNQIQFTITAGATPFANLDEFDITVTLVPLGSAIPNVPIYVADKADAQAFFGAGSMLERMANAFFNNNFAARLVFLPLLDPSAGVAASGSITCSAPPNGSGIVTLYIAGQRVQVGVTGTETAANMATNLAAAINAIPTMVVTAAVDGTNTAKVNITCKWKGATGNDISFIFNYGGSLAGEAFPSGIAYTVVAMASGAGAPSDVAAIAAMGDDEYDYCCVPYTDSVTLGDFETEFGFGDTGRWGWMRQLYGSIFTARRDTYANLMTWGATGNSPVSSVMAVEPGSPSPVWEWAAAYTAQAARAFLNDPARPLQTLEFTGILPAPKGARFNKTQLNNMASTGLAVQQTSPDGPPMIMVEASRYQKNVYGQGDTAYFVITTLHTLAAIYRRLLQSITSKYPRHKLANDGTRFGPGQAIVTPNVIRAELVAQYREMEYDGLVENPAAFASHLIVERDDNNPNRCNVLYPADIVNQLRTLAILSQFRLQFSTLDQTV
jgi:phage tail sheath gpL-like